MTLLKGYDILKVQKEKETPQTGKEKIMTVHEFLNRIKGIDFLRGRHITMRGDFEHPFWGMNTDKKLKDVKLTKNHIYLYV